MNVEPVKMSTAKKIAIGVGTAAAIGVTAYAVIKGQKITGKPLKGDSFEKTMKNGLEAAKVGFKEIGKLIKKNVIKPIYNFISGKYNSKVKPTVDSKVEAVKNAYDSKVKATVNNAVETVKGAYNNRVKPVVDTVSKKVSEVKPGEKVEEIKEEISLEKVAEDAKNIAEEIEKKAEVGAQKAKEVIEKAKEGIQKTVPNYDGSMWYN